MGRTAHEPTLLPSVLTPRGQRCARRGTWADRDEQHVLGHPLHAGQESSGVDSEVLACRLRRRLAVIDESGGQLRRGELLDDARAASATFVAVAEQAPAAFVKHVLPVVLQISDRALTGEEPPRRDAVWTWLVRTRHPSGEDACLSGLATALAALAGDETNDMQDVLTDLRGRDTHVANHLLLALFRGGAARYADDAISLLCAEPWRFECGFSDSPRWCAIETIRSLIRHCSPENRERLEGVILRYVSSYERTKGGYRLHGRARFALLSAIPDELRSSGARAHARELERKFHEPEGEPRGVTGGLVTSPIKGSAADKMTDEQWLRAITKYDSEGVSAWSDDGLRGGATELARDLGARVKDAPERFARLSLSFPPDANPAYLEGLHLAGSGAGVKILTCTNFGTVA